jgi:FkbM family methyltransferase
MISRIYNLFKKFFQFKDHCASIILGSTKQIEHNGTIITFCTPNALCDYRAISFSKKEPDTLNWIDSLEEGKIFWDIGANIGVYSLYVALKKKAKVWAFEPSLFNLEVLSRNINLNHLQESIFILPNALSNRIGFNLMTHSNTSWGGALSAFDKDYGYDGKQIKKVFSYNILGMTLDFAVQYLGLPLPDYIKMDVDGIEHLILDGGNNSIQNAKEILIEINEDFIEQRDMAQEVLKNSGFWLASKGEYHHPTIKIANQIWKK